MHDVLETVYGCDLALATLVGSALDNDLVILADGNGADLQWNILDKSSGGMWIRAYIVLLTEFCRMLA